MRTVPHLLWMMLLGLRSWLRMMIDAWGAAVASGGGGGCDVLWRYNSVMGVADQPSLR